MENRELLIKRIIFVILAVFSVTNYSSPPIALLLGIIASQFIPNVFSKISKFSKYLLQASVVGLGFGMNLNDAFKVSQDGFLLTFVFISSTIVIGYFLGNFLGLRKNTTYLVSSGTAICGGSAIAAVAPAIEAENEDISVSLGIVFILNSLALLIFPAIGHYLDLSQSQFGMWAAIAIHDTSSVVGAAQIYGDEALKIATTVKLGRALWIIPLVLVFSFIMKKKAKKSSFPIFILFFILVMAFNNFLPIMETLSKEIVMLSKKGLSLTLFFIGSGLTLASIKKVGVKAILFGLILWILVLVSSLLIVINYY